MRIFSNSNLEKTQTTKGGLLNMLMNKFKMNDGTAVPDFQQSLTNATKLPNDVETSVSSSLFSHIHNGKDSDNYKEIGYNINDVMYTTADEIGHLTINDITILEKISNKNLLKIDKKNKITNEDIIMTSEDVEKIIGGNIEIIKEQKYGWKKVKNNVGKINDINIKIDDNYLSLLDVIAAKYNNINNNITNEYVNIDEVKPHKISSITTLMQTEIQSPEQHVLINENALNILQFIIANDIQTNVTQQNIPPLQIENKPLNKQILVNVDSGFLLTPNRKINEGTILNIPTLSKDKILLTHKEINNLENKINTPISTSINNDNNDNLVNYESIKKEQLLDITDETKQFSGANKLNTSANVQTININPINLKKMFSSEAKKLDMYINEDNWDIIFDVQINGEHYVISDKNNLFSVINKADYADIEIHSFSSTNPFIKASNINDANNSNLFDYKNISDKQNPIITSNEMKIADVKEPSVQSEIINTHSSIKASSINDANNSNLFDYKNISDKQNPIITSNEMKQFNTLPVTPSYTELQTGQDTTIQNNQEQQNDNSEQNATNSQNKWQYSASLIVNNNENIINDISTFIGMTEKINNVKNSQVSNISTFPSVFYDVRTNDIPKVVNNFATSIGLNGIGVARIILNPKELGNIYVEINLDDVTPVVSFKATNKEAIEAIEANVSKLKEMLSINGMKDVDVKYDRFINDTKSLQNNNQNNNNNSNQNFGQNFTQQQSKHGQQSSHQEYIDIMNSLKMADETLDNIE